MAQWLQRQWYRIGPWHLLLIPLSWVFWLLSSLRRASYQLGLCKTYRLPVPVIVVGNISVGGTGKTPLVIWLVRKLREAGYRPGIISRGYGGGADGISQVEPDSDPQRVGDEPVVLARRCDCPVWVGRDRIGVAQALLIAAPEVDVIISDDGLQHYRLGREFEIAVIDGQRQLGNGLLLPAGPLREPAQRLEMVDAVVQNGGDAKPDRFVMQLELGDAVSLQNNARRLPLKDLVGKRLHVIAGIGNPDRFFGQLREMGLQFTARAFPDHHAYTPADLQIAETDTILMTEKDAVKCVAFAQPNWWYLSVEALVDEALSSRVVQKIRN